MVKATNEQLLAMDKEVSAEDLAEQMLLEQGFEKRGDKWVRPKAKRVSRITYGQDPRENVKKLMSAVVVDMQDTYKRLLQATNGKVQRSSVSLPLGSVKEGDLQKIRDTLLEYMDGIDRQVLAGRRTVTGPVIDFDD